VYVELQGVKKVHGASARGRLSSMGERAGRSNGRRSAITAAAIQLLIAERSTGGLGDYKAVPVITGTRPLARTRRRAI